MSIALRKPIEIFRKTWMQIALSIILILPLAIGFSLFYKAWPLLESVSLGNLFLGSVWSPSQGNFGLFPFISSSVFVAGIGLIIMIPVCLSSAIYITQFAPRWISRILRTAIDILAGMPSVIFGLWGVITIVPIVGNWAKQQGAQNPTGYSILAAGIVVSISVMPYVLNMLLELFESVTSELKETALSLGASHWQAIKDVFLKKLKPGIIAAFTLGMSKSFGETIAVLMVVGNVVQIPGSIFDAGYPLPALLANNYGEMMSIPNYDAALMLSALILLLMVIFFNYLSHKVIRHYQAKA